MAFNTTTGATAGRRRHRLNADINVTPFIDVMLVLLVVFMVSAPLMVTGVEVSLPEENNAALESKEQPLVVTIQKSGALYVQDQPIQKEALIQKLTSILQTRTDSSIYLRGDADLAYGKIMQLMSMLSQAGFTNIAFVTENVDAS